MTPFFLTALNRLFDGKKSGGDFGFVVKFNDFKNWGVRCHTNNVLTLPRAKLIVLENLRSVTVDFHATIAILIRVCCRPSTFSDVYQNTFKWLSEYWPYSAQQYFNGEVKDCLPFFEVKNSVQRGRYKCKNISRNFKFAH